MLLPVPLPSSFLLFFHQLLSSFSENTGWEVFFEGFKIFNYSLQISDLKQRARTIFFSNTDIVPLRWQPVESKTSLQPISLNSFLSLFTQITLESSCHKLATATYALSLSISALLKILLELFWKRLCLAATNDVCIKKNKIKVIYSDTTDWKSFEILGYQFFWFVNWIYFVWSLCIYTYPGNLGVCQRQWRKQLYNTCSLLKIMANKVLTFPHLPSYLGSSIPPSAPSRQNNTKSMEDPTLLCYTEGILLFLQRKAEHWMPSVPSSNLIIWTELVFSFDFFYAL